MGEREEDRLVMVVDREYEELETKIEGRDSVSSSALGTHRRVESNCEQMNRSK